MLNNYIKDVFRVSRKGDAREESFYKALASLLEISAQQLTNKKIDVTILPKKTEAGNPDFRVWDGNQHITGYIEAKPPTEENLERIAESEQLKRYRSTFPNVILTNFFEFLLYRDGELIDKVQIARPVISLHVKTCPPIENEEKFEDLFKKFFSFSLPRNYTPKTLAESLAARTHYLREQVELELLISKSRLNGFYQAFEQHLIAGLTKQDFADMYAQTITYGLFAASTRTSNGFSRKQAFDNIPHTIGILRDVFRYVSLEEPGPNLIWIIDDIAEILSVANVKNVLHKYYFEGKGSDPIVHFYETFLAEYDPQEREQRGVYYTPEDVVSYIVRSLNIVLREYFDKTDGFATKSVTVLDPAAGTLTFIAQAAAIAVNEFCTAYGSGGKKELIKKHILKNFFAFELMMAPYAVGHLKIGFLLEELGYKLEKDDRFNLFLTNTLDMKELAESNLPGTSSLSQESHEAGKIKRETPILAILGNPPYSGHSVNKGEWISKEIREYRKIDGKDLGEKNPKWLQDDYVKFIRFAQWKIDQAGQGVLGFITNHSYLDNPTFRGMRRSLMNSFEHIYILDLHGNSKKKEVCPDGSKDENVFDIQQGVAILIAIKKKGLKKKVMHRDDWGLRQTKYDWLKTNDIETTKWETLKPESEFYFFVPRDEKYSGRYNKYVKITDIFPENSVGVVTSRDKFLIAPTKSEIEKRIRMFIDENLSDNILKKTFNLKDETDWTVKEAREKIRKTDDWEKQIVQILYRPFDKQWIFYNDVLVERMRKEIMRHMMHENIALCVGRAGQVVGTQNLWNIAFCSDCIQDLNLFYRGGNVNFPLYTYPDANLFNGGSNYQREVNIPAEMYEKFKECYGKKVQPEQILSYIYAVLYSNIYRSKYAQFLKTDFPKIPFCSDPAVFAKMAKLGQELINLHLIKSDKLDKPIAKFEGKGNTKVEKVCCDVPKKRVFVNPDSYFDNISPEIWEYRIGGYQVMEKWLKDRKERKLTLEEIKLYCKIATSVKETIELQNHIDKIYPDVEKTIIEI
ncbi:MAG: DNA methyltransferase [Planctomycetes bacterium HGW-Planctomycetes-1]|nr:MAG: DNA methyltransferase [Planctomycetes bacterium HGW-Planctomycetes-1]